MAQVCCFVLGTLVDHAGSCLCFSKAQMVIAYQHIYRHLAVGPTNKHKAKLVTLLRKIKKESRWMRTQTKPCVPCEHVLVSSMDFQNASKEHSP